tara:strand:- start:1097 stop:1234 length:138 start_codon:yes stop_codon:yes gene_type:complete
MTVLKAFSSLFKKINGSTGLLENNPVQPVSNQSQKINSQKVTVLG